MFIEQQIRMISKNNHLTLNIGVMFAKHVHHLKKQKQQRLNNLSF